ncbi:MAG: DUF3106 domain-containing protein [Polynucleobacter sp.]|nr:DUF3106 domain-containing protein [Polynucleobacter sp.]
MSATPHQHNPLALAAKRCASGWSLGALLLLASWLAIGSVNEVAAQTKQPTAASAPKHSGNWDDLSLVQQKILAPLEEDWSYLSKERRQKWIQVANLYPKMKRVDQERLQSRMNEWSKLSQKDRRIARDNYLSSLRFPAEEKASAWQAYQQLSPEDKKKLAAKEDNKKKPTAASSPTLQNRPNALPAVTPAAAPTKDGGA